MILMACVDGRKQNVIVAYDALQKWDDAKGEWVKDEDNEGKSLKVGVLYKAVKSDSDGYFTAIRPVKLDNEFVTEVAHDAFWITDSAEGKSHGYLAAGSPEANARGKDE